MDNTYFSNDIKCVKDEPLEEEKIKTEVVPAILTKIERAPAPLEFVSVPQNEGNLVFMCSICYVNFHFKIHLLKHIYLVHRPLTLAIEGEVYCDKCCHWFETANDYDEHLSSNNLSCPFCYTPMPSATHFIYHNLKYIASNSFECMLCPRLSGNTSNFDICDLNLHMRNKHGKNGVYKCFKCNVYFGLRFNLDLHTNFYHKDCICADLDICTCRIKIKPKPKVSRLKAVDKINNEQKNCAVTNDKATSSCSSNSQSNHLKKKVTSKDAKLDENLPLVLNKSKAKTYSRCKIPKPPPILEFSNPNISMIVKNSDLGIDLVEQSTVSEPKHDVEDLFMVAAKKQKPNEIVTKNKKNLPNMLHKTNSKFSSKVPSPLEKVLIRIKESQRQKIIQSALSQDSNGTQKEMIAKDNSLTVPTSSKNTSDSLSLNSTNSKTIDVFPSSNTTQSIPSKKATKQKQSDTDSSFMLFEETALVTEDHSDELKSPSIVSESPDLLIEKALKFMQTNTSVSKNNLDTLTVCSKKSNKKLKDASICIVCDTYFVEPYELELHNRRLHRPWALEKINNVYCYKCTSWFDDELEYRGHSPCYNYAYSVKKKCSLCLMVDPLPEHFNLHNITYFKNLYWCKLCKNNGTRLKLEKLNCHMREVHGKNGAFECLQCKLTFKNPKSLKVHLFSHDAKSSTDFYAVCKENSDYFKCPVCGKVLVNKNYFETHYRTHDGRLCSTCGMNFSSKHRYDEHMNVTHLKNKIFKCKVCDDTFLSKKYLLQHTKIHTNTKKFNCLECDLSFAQQTSLIYHMAIHTKEDIFTCSVCKIKFDLQSKLTSHMKIHNENGTNPNVCKICDKQFAHKCNLIVHMRTHPQTKENIDK